MRSSLQKINPLPIFVMTNADDADWDASVKDGLSYRDMVNRDKARWKVSGPLYLLLWS